MVKVKTEQVKQENMEPPSVVKSECEPNNVKSKDSVAKASVEVPFKVDKYHTMALLKLLFCHYTEQTLTYNELSDEIGAGKKTKAWQCVAWKDLKSNDYIIPAPHGDGGETKYQLSPSGVKLAKSFASDEDLAEYKMPETNEEHHEKIKSKLMRQDKKAQKYGPKIFDYFVETKDDDPMTKHEIAEHFNTLADSHSFFYGFQALIKMGMICKVRVPASSKGTKRKRQTKDENPEECKNEISNLDENEDDGKKKKKKLSGGAAWKLTEKAFLRTVSNSTD